MWQELAASRILWGTDRAGTAAVYCIWMPLCYRQDWDFVSRDGGAHLSQLLSFLLQQPDGLIVLCLERLWINLPPCNPHEF